MTDKQINKILHIMTVLFCLSSTTFPHLPPCPVQYTQTYPQPTDPYLSYTTDLLEFKYDAENCFWQLSIKLEVNTGLLIFYFFAKHIVSALDYKYLTFYCK